MRAVREVLLRDETKYQHDKQEQQEERELVGSTASGLRRSVNGRSW